MFSLRLKELRESHNLSQQSFANIINVSQSTVGMWESGKRTPDSEMLAKIADYFDVSVDYLIGRSSEYSVNDELKGVDFALYNETKELNDSQKKDVLKFVQFLKNKDEE